MRNTLYVTHSGSADIP